MASPTQADAVKAFEIASARKFHARYVEKTGVWIAETHKQTQIRSAGTAVEPWQVLIAAEAATIAGEERMLAKAQQDAMDALKAGTVERRLRPAGPDGQEAYFVARRPDGSEEEATSPEEAVRKAKAPRPPGPSPVAPASGPGGGPGA